MSVKTKSIFSGIILIFYLLLASGSFSEEEGMIFFIIFLIIGVVLFIIINPSSKNKEKMNEQRKAVEEEYPNCKTLMYNNYDMTLYSLPESNDLLISVVTKDDYKNVILKDILPSFYEQVNYYQYIADDINERIFIVKYHGKSFTTQSFKYDDIISLEIIENDITTYKKSTTRTLGGALAGGILFGGAGAVVGGLSGSSTSNREISKYEVKLLIRNVNNPSCILTLIASTISKEDSVYKNINLRANNIKDSVNVIIDKIDRKYRNQQNQQNITNNVVDELVKLSQLHESGHITDIEYEQLKNNILKKN